MITVAVAAGTTEDVGKKTLAAECVAIPLLAPVGPNHFLIRKSKWG